MTKKLLEPIHPGEILMEEFLKPMDISQYRLSRYFGLSGRFWVNLQARYDLEKEKDRLKNRLDEEVHVYASAV